MAPMTRGFVALIESYAEAYGVPLITFEKGARKDDVVKPYFAGFKGEEGVVVVGKAQEKTRVLRTVKRRNAKTTVYDLPYGGHRAGDQHRAAT